MALIYYTNLQICAKYHMDYIWRCTKSNPCNVIEFLTFIGIQALNFIFFFFKMSSKKWHKYVNVGLHTRRQFWNILKLYDPRRYCDIYPLGRSNFHTALSLLPNIKIIIIIIATIYWWMTVFRIAITETIMCFMTIKIPKKTKMISL